MVVCERYTKLFLYVQALIRTGIHCLFILIVVMCLFPTEIPFMFSSGDTGIVISFYPLSATTTGAMPTG